MRILPPALAGGLLSLVFAAAGPSPAAAASCDSFRFTMGGGEYTYEVFGLATRDVSCRRAKDFTRDYHRPSNNDAQLECGEGGKCTYRRYRCTASNTAARSVHRCSRGARVIRWKFRYVEGA